jgi:hypothetical protein
MTFSDPKDVWIDNSSFRTLVPKGISTQFYNLYSQASGEGDMTVKFINSMTAMFVGTTFGATIGENGTTLIPQWSGMAKNTSSLNDPRADVMKRSYNGHVLLYLDDLMEINSLLLQGTAATLTALDVTSYLFPGISEAAKATAALAASISVSANIISAIGTGIYDLRYSHEAPLLKEHQTGWKANENTYHDIFGKEKKYEPYQMEEFLYEKPFVTLRVASNYSPDWKEDENSYTLGLYIGDSLKPLPIAPDKLSAPLAFKSSSDWGILGAKKERWERVKGLEDSIPIRHADRYAMQNISVKDFITKYSFIVDDLMPHRLRQIRINFNFTTDIAWDCEDDNSAVLDTCSFYTRSADGWEFEGKYQHPVDKNGTFDFFPKNYDLTPLSLQKDNQNVVTITTTNKIGLSNTQRFHYLFTATKDLIEPHWPVQGVKLTSINNFQIHADALDYQDVTVQYGKDHILPNTLNKNSALYIDMIPDNANSSSTTYTSKFAVDNLTEGPWNWHYEIKIGENNIWEGSIPFTIDTTPPNISLKANENINPNTSTFMARFINNSELTKDESLRLVYMRLDKMENNAVKNSYHLPLLSHVISPEFGITWEGPGTNLEDSKYRLNAIAFDGAVGSIEQYSLMNNVTAGTEEISKLFANFHSLATQPGYNASLASTDFVIDKTPPEITSFALLAEESGKDKPQFSINDSETLTLNKDRTLRINYTITEHLLGRDSTQINLLWEFLDKKDSATVLHRIGDNINMKNNAQSFSWEETSQMQLLDGDYIIRMKATDAAGNEKFALANKSLHIDRTAPVITTITSTQRTYTQVPPADGYAAVMHFKQNDEITANRSKLKCYYRIPPNKNWIFFAETENDVKSITIPIDASYIGTTFGKRYVEGGCMDAAGNFASNADVFFVGYMTPRIVYPDSSDVLTQPIIAIRGFTQTSTPAAASMPEDGNSAYRLRWRANGENEWHTEGIDVGTSKLNDDTPWISKEIYAEENDLAFWHRENLPHAVYQLELSSRQCGNCDWVSDTMQVTLGNAISEGANIKIAINSPSSAIGGEEEQLSMRIEGAYGKDFRVRFYGKDASGMSLFDKSSNKMKDSPLLGKPANISGEGIWLWSEIEGEYHLQWNGLPERDSLMLAYKQGSIGEVCKNMLSGCKEMPWKEFSKEYEKMSGIPAGLNKVMILSGASGHLTFSNKEAFYAIFSLKKPSLTVHIGAQNSELEELANASGMVVVNPGLYGLNTLWNGLTDTEHYPAYGTAHIYAEIFENAPNGVVLRASKEMFITQPPLKIVTAEKDTLAEFYVVSHGASGLELGSKTFSYGIQGRDAIVKAWIENSDGKIIKNHLLGENGTRQNATNSKSAYTLLWDGMDKDEFVNIEAGIYKFVVSAKEFNGEETATLFRPFKLTMAGMQLATGLATDASGSAIKIAEAVIDPNNPERQNYAPTADYLVKADLSGYTLPDSLRTVNIGYELGGTQVARGYKPKRFSLGVKRQRDSLELVILYRVKIKYHQPYTYINPIMPWRSIICDWADRGYRYHYGSSSVSFKNRGNNPRFSNVAIDIERYGGGYGFKEDSGPAYLEVWAVLPKDYKKYENAEIAINNIVNKTLKPIWSLTSIEIPNRQGGRKASIKPPIGENGYCNAEDKPDGNICNEKSVGYDPNANLFDLTISTVSKEGEYFTNYKDIGDNCDNDASTTINMNLALEIPDAAYWNVPFGYDNLVNRTIRLDHTNITMFGDNGYLKFANNAGNLYYDGSDWKIDNLHYGMLTPFEIQRFHFISADYFSSAENVSLFPDEDKDHKYPSRFHAKFYNTDTAQGRFNAYLNGECVTGNNCNLSFRQDTASNTFTTGLMKHGTASIYVTLEANPENFERVDISYPASSNWIDSLKANNANVCPDYKDNGWTKINAYTADCLKFYRAGSKVHYYLNDYNDSAWASKMLTANGNTFDNMLNNPSFIMKADSPETMLGLKPYLMGRKNINDKKISLNPDNYNKQTQKFFLNSSDINYPTISPDGISASITPVIDGLDSSKYRWKRKKSRLCPKQARPTSAPRIVVIC